MLHGPWTMDHGPWSYRHYCVMLTWNHFSIISLSATAVSYDSVTCIFFFLRIFYSTLHNRSANLHTHQQCLSLTHQQSCILPEFVVCFLENSHLVWDEMEFQCSFVLFCIFICLKWMNIFIYLLTI